MKEIEIWNKRFSKWVKDVGLPDRNLDEALHSWDFDRWHDGSVEFTAFKNGKVVSRQKIPASVVNQLMKK